MNVSQIFGQDEPLSSMTLRGAADPEQRVAGGRTDLQTGGDRSLIVIVTGRMTLNHERI